MPCEPAPACKSLLAEATRLWPNRNKASDGICASPKHTQQNPSSDHEVGNAVDLTDDKTNGCDADAFAEMLRLSQDPRVKYVICNRRMWSSYATSKRKAYEWGPYTGANPHEKHTHVSIHKSARNDVSPWFTHHTPPAEDDDMALNDDDKRMILALDVKLEKVLNALSGYGTNETGKRLDGAAASPKTLSTIGKMADLAGVEPKR